VLSDILLNCCLAGLDCRSRHRNYPDMHLSDNLEASFENGESASLVDFPSSRIQKFRSCQILDMIELWAASLGVHLSIILVCTLSGVSEDLTTLPFTT